MLIDTIILATRNAHKTAELKQMLGDRFGVRNLAEFSDVPEVVEDATTFGGNATKKGVTIANWLAATTPKATNWFVLADDSGLEVDLLNGAPGVLSARFAALDTGAKGNSPDVENNAKLLRLLSQKPLPWKARFRCVLALTPVPAKSTATPNTCLMDEAELATRLFDGACEGRIVPNAAGAHGFGYDPLFVPDGFNKTFAELGDDVKNRISHRAQAMKKLQEAIVGVGKSTL